MGSRPLLGGARTSSRYSTVATPLASLASALNSTGNVLGSSSVKFDKGGGLSRVTAGGVRSARQGSGARVVVLVELVVVVEVLVVLVVVVVVVVGTSVVVVGTGTGLSSTTRPWLACGSLFGLSDRTSITTSYEVVAVWTAPCTPGAPKPGVKPRAVNVIVESHPTVVTAPFTATLNLRGKGPELSHMKKRSGIGSVPVILGWVSSPPSRNTLNTALNAAAGANVGGGVGGAAGCVVGIGGCVVGTPAPPPPVTTSTVPVTPATPAPTTAASAAPERPPAAKPAGSDGKTGAAALGTNGATARSLQSSGSFTTSGR